MLVVYFFNEVTGRNLHRVYKEFSGVLQGAEERRRFPTVEDYAKNAIPLAYKMIGAYRTGSDDSSSHSYRTMARPERGLMRRRTVANRIPSSPIELKPGYFPAQPYGSAKFTVYIITYDRDKTLRYIIRHYGKSHLVDRIIISWNNIGRKPPAADSFDVDCPIHVSVCGRETLVQIRFIIPLKRSDFIITFFFIIFYRISFCAIRSLPIRTNSLHANFTPNPLDHRRD